MAALLLALGTMICSAGVLTALGMLNTNFGGVAGGLMITLIGVVLFGAGAIVDAIDKLRKTTAAPEKPPEVRA